MLGKRFLNFLINYLNQHGTKTSVRWLHIRARNTVPKFFILFLFDLSLMSLIWLLCVNRLTEQYNDEVKKEIADYSTWATSLCRSVLLFFTQAVFPTSDWWIIPISTIGSSTFLIIEIFNYMWKNDKYILNYRDFNTLLLFVHIHSYIIVCLFIIAWTEFKFFNVNMVPKELSGDNFEVQPSSIEPITIESPFEEVNDSEILKKEAETGTNQNSGSIKSERESDANENDFKEIDGSNSPDRSQAHREPLENINDLPERPQTRRIQLEEVIQRIYTEELLGLNTEQNQKSSSIASENSFITNESGSDTSGSIASESGSIASENNGITNESGSDTSGSIASESGSIASENNGITNESSLISNESDSDAAESEYEELEIISPNSLQNIRLQEFKYKGRAILEATYELITANDWTLKKTNSNEDSVFLKYDSRLGNIFKLKCVVPITSQLLLDVIYYKVEEVSTWNPNVNLSKIVETVDKYTDIVYQVVDSNVISTRDFVSLRQWEKRDENYLIGVSAIEHDNIPPVRNNVRGENKTCGCLIKPLGDRCELQMLFHIDLKGWLFQSVIDQAMVSVIFDYAYHLKNHVSSFS